MCVCMCVRVMCVMYVVYVACTRQKFSQTFLPLLVIVTNSIFAKMLVFFEELRRMSQKLYYDICISGIYVYIILHFYIKTNLLNYFLLYTRAYARTRAKQIRVYSGTFIVKLNK